MLSPDSSEFGHDLGTAPNSDESGWIPLLAARRINSANWTDFTELPVFDFIDCNAGTDSNDTAG